jgi:hypothetical protein
MTSTMRFDKWENSLGQPYGTVLQVVSKTSSTAHSVGVAGNTTYYDFPNNELRIEITPRFATSRMLLMANISIGGGSGANNAAFRFTKNSQIVGVGDVTGSRPRSSAITGYLQGADSNHGTRTISASFLDSPATTSSLVYNIQGASESSNLLWNRTPSFPDTNVIYGATLISSFTIMEIAQ